MQENPSQEPRTLLKFLTGAGVGSRRHCFRLISEGRVTVNGQPALGATTPVDPAQDRVAVDGGRVSSPERKLYLKLHKPLGVISTTSDDWGRRTVMAMAPKSMRHAGLFPVGRLDAQTTGLVLLTNDGELAHRLTHPRYEVEKEYHAELDGPLTPEQLSALERGVVINGVRTGAAVVRELPDREGAWYSVTLREGKKRQVRLMCLAVGNLARSLHRVRIHNLSLGRLPVGQVGELSHREVKRLLTVLSPGAASKEAESQMETRIENQEEAEEGN